MSEQTVCPVDRRARVTAAPFVKCTRSMAHRQVFRDRVDAGGKLGAALRSLREERPLVLGLPRGGVPVAREVAEALGAPLDVCVVRKVGAPFHEELGMGAVAEGGEVVLDEDIIRSVGATREQVQKIVATKQREVEARCRLFRPHRTAPDVSGRTVILVDDGVATGGTARAAIRAIKRRGAARVVFAVPVGATEALDALASEADDVVCLMPRPDLYAIGEWYADFRAVDDEEVIAILDASRSSILPQRAIERAVEIDIGRETLDGDLALPLGARGLVLFAHGSGSSRKSSRNRAVAATLRRAGIGTLLFDLLTRDEEVIDAIDARLRFDIELLTGRLNAATEWVRGQPELRKLAIGYFGASTGAAAALNVAALRTDVRAVVSRGGRTDLASYAERVRAPTLLIVGGADTEVLALNRGTLAQLTAPKRLEIVAGATHLFEEPGALEHVAKLAADWFGTHLGKREVTAPTQVAQRRHA